MKLFLIATCLMITSVVTFAQTLPENPGRALRKDIKRITETKDYHISKPNHLPPDKQGSYFEVRKDSTTRLFGYMGRQKSCRRGGCESPSSSENYDYFDYFILFSTEGKVLKVNVYNYQSSHGYQITARSWLKQFINYKGGKKLEAGRDVDTISGATISSNAITQAVSNKTIKLKNHLL
ncbi:MAG: FMN-binding protein [Bacteroidales bacterium]|nr:FMN-binding protein [Bacteroidales bacterium]MCF8328683.1 FMN-binding protein [Bacteroidales bacterium]